METSFIYLVEAAM